MRKRYGKKVAKNRIWGSMLGPFWEGLGTKNRKKANKNGDDFLSGILKPIWLPKSKKVHPSAGYAKAYLGSFWSSDMSKRRANYSLKL